MNKRVIVLGAGALLILGMVFGIGSKVKGNLDIPETKEQSANWETEPDSSEVDDSEVDKENRILAAVSPNGNYEIFTKEGDLQTVFIYHKKLNKVEKIKVEDELLLTTGVMSLSWVNDEEIAVESHVNPSLNCLDIYQIKNKKKVLEKYGTLFEWEGEDYTSMTYVLPAPHFSDYIGKEEVKDFDDNTLYQTEKNEVIENIAVNEQNENLAVITSMKDMKKGTKKNRKLYMMEKKAGKNYKKVKEENLSDKKVDTLDWSGKGKVVLKTDGRKRTVQYDN